MSRVFIAEDLKENSLLTITGEKHHYLRHVLRLNKGDPLFLFNGTAKEYKAIIAGIGKNKLSVQIFSGSEVSKESPIETVIGQAIPKGNKLDDLIPKITELGATGLVALITERSDVKSISPQKISRWQKIAEHSTQQTGRTQVLSIESPLTFLNFLKKYSDFEKIIFYELETSQSFKDILIKSASQKFCLIIGPEGGFTPQEISLGLEHGCKIVSLGTRILRTETVAPAVMAILQYVKGDLNRHE